MSDDQLPDTDELYRDFVRARDVDRTEATALVRRLRKQVLSMLRTIVLLSRISAPDENGGEGALDIEDEDEYEFLDVEEAARILRVHSSWIRRHERELPFCARLIPDGPLRIEKRRLERFIRDKLDGERDA